MIYKKKKAIKEAKDTARCELFSASEIKLTENENIGPRLFQFLSE